jgi:peptidoglycan/LPS O-acetylase OafA/YrhL
MVAMAFHRGFGAFWIPEDYLRDLWGGVLFFGLWGPFAATILIIVYCGSALSRALEFPLFRYLGRISYGLYFYHFPILLLAGSRLSKLGLGPPTSAMVILLLTVAISIASFELIERPFLRMKERPVQRIQLGEAAGTESRREISSFRP